MFAFSNGDMLITPGFGLGASSGTATVWSGADLSYYLTNGSNTTWFKDGTTKYSFAWSIGCGFDYFFNDSVSLTTGLSYDSVPFKVVYEKNTFISDCEITFKLSYLTIPLGVHWYPSIFMIGGGLYYGLTLSNDAKIKVGSSSENFSADTSSVLGFFIDAGVNLDVANGNLLLFAKFRSDLTYAYTEDGDLVTDVKTRAFTINAAYGFKL
ncbi:MAG: outer membrane beta-barrel protein [Spirochaetia bacterium]|nr:outer membrane beta-barrel protein [Spirochaetia bacterium]